MYIWPNLGIERGKLFPVPNYDITKYPEYRKYVKIGFHNAPFNFRLDGTRIGEISQDESPSRNKETLSGMEPQKEFPVPELPEMPNEHSPCLKDMDL